LCTTKYIGLRKIREIINYFGDIKNVWNGNFNDFIGTKCLKPETIKNLIERRNKEKLTLEIESIKNKGIDLLSIDDVEYPSRLKSIYDPPPILYTKGKYKKCQMYISIVGSRKCSSDGRMIAREFSKKLSQMGIGIISGLARGIDTEAHIGALNGNGFTCAVLGCGCDITYPPENGKLMNAIEKDGYIVSEYPPGTQPFSYNFPARNRIISGLSDGVLIVEAGDKSGALITVDYALEQGKEVFAIPGSILNSMSKGTNMLIRDGAKIVTGIEDIFNEFGIENIIQESDNQQDDLSEKENQILKTVSDSPIHIDDLVKKISIRVGELNSALTSLELKGIIKILPGKYIVKSI
jgi:DNA processing protein